MPAGVNIPLLLAFGLSGGAALLAALQLWAKRRPSDAEAPIDWPLTVFLAIVSVTIFAGWLSVILASINLFSAWLVALALLLVAVLILWKTRPIRFRSFTAATRYEIALGVLLLGSAVVYFRPHEYILGGSDAGTYMNIATTAARTGQFVVHDEWSAFLRTAPEVTLREQPAPALTRYLQFVGYYLDDADPARVIPQFFPFHPLLLALGVSVGGVWGGLLVTPVWSVLSLAAVYFVTRKLFSAPIALLAATLLALTPTHIYFARYPTTEPLTLLLVFSALLGFQMLWDDRAASVGWGVLGGAALGAALLTRLDLPVVLIIFVAALIVVRLRGQWSRGWTWFAVMLSVFVVHLVLDVALINWPYFWNSYGALRFLFNSPALIVAGALGVIGAIGLSVIAWHWRARWAPSIVGIDHFVTACALRAGGGRDRVERVCVFCPARAGADPDGAELARQRAVSHLKWTELGAHRLVHHAVGTGAGYVGAGTDRAARIAAADERVFGGGHADDRPVRVQHLQHALSHLCDAALCADCVAHVDDLRSCRVGSRVARATLVALGGGWAGRALDGGPDLPISFRAADP